MCTMSVPMFRARGKGRGFILEKLVGEVEASGCGRWWWKW